VEVIRSTAMSERSTPTPNRLAQDFSATDPDRKWLVDITYLATCEGWLLVVFGGGARHLFAAYCRLVDERTARLSEPLICDALCMALI
jgi:putative transposase